MDVGVRELKEHLSQYLERAARGEIIRVTERRQPKAILGPLPGTDQLARGIAEGWVRAAEKVAPLPVKRGRARRRIDEKLEDDRRE